MFLTDILIGVFVLFSIARGVQLSVRKQFKKTISLVGGIGIAYVVFCLESISEIVTKGIDLFNDIVVEGYLTKYSQYYTGSYSNSLKVVLFLLVSIIGYYLVHFVISLIIKNPSQEKILVYSYIRNWRFFRLVFALINTAIIGLVIYQILFVFSDLLALGNVKNIGVLYDYLVDNKTFNFLRNWLEESKVFPISWK
jgi:hypothetical protein